MFVLAVNLEANINWGVMF